ncbi:hypothetical protein BpHYR1_017270 [Brachionus plicatilis]|uniref:Uncharacterized protein n=1 Tax=Brachionus plicatilis TaxID=10195 RepID=A0A3M7RAB6_BRAPC|nr:hypothetical protein BpHYR1_017270 [Brachionus plicatilis]
MQNCATFKVASTKNTFNLNSEVPQKINCTLVIILSNTWLEITPKSFNRTFYGISFIIFSIKIPYFSIVVIKQQTVKIENDEMF